MNDIDVWRSLPQNYFSIIMFGNSTIKFSTFTIAHIYAMSTVLTNDGTLYLPIDSTGMRYINLFNNNGHEDAFLYNNFAHNICNNNAFSALCGITTYRVLNSLKSFTNCGDVPIFNGQYLIKYNFTHNANLLYKMKCCEYTKIITNVADSFYAQLYTININWFSLFFNQSEIINSSYLVNYNADEITAYYKLCGPLKYAYVVNFLTNVTNANRLYTTLLFNANTALNHFDRIVDKVVMPCTK
jgi:hypothetical protein